MAYNLRVTAIEARKARTIGVEVAGHIVSASRKQRTGREPGL